MSGVRDDYGSGGPALSFDQWAQLTAMAVGLDPESRLEHLEGHGCSTAVDRYWCQTLVDDIARGRLARTTRIGELIADEMRRRGALTEIPVRPHPVRQENSVLPNPRAREPVPAPELATVMRGATPVTPPTLHQTHTALSQPPQSSVRSSHEALDWPVQRFARFKAELESGLPADDVCRRYGLASPEVRSEVEQIWVQRLTHDAGLRLQFQKAFDAAASELAAHREPP
ncbi:MAG: hypothetical protein AAGA56_06985 [Myxococcota bacterium]